ncbi:PhnD/SsuA/transferrin family substrate-binding protein [Neotabrizicola sp. VNH66]|uniref:PhnD/SsuA/transferrin family substrate-binding protein n=1 Tax=Neotabrizicola sp. VNH66 TaxID=3400918 RepID=UPI003C0A0BF5
MIASLAMYDFGPAQAANDRLWALVRDRLRARGMAAPEWLTRGEGAYWRAWQSPDLILSQTCGYPYRARLHGHVTLVAAPVLDLPETAPGMYHSVFVARADDPRDGLAAFQDAPFAWNEDLSQSGWAAAANHVAALGLRLRPALRTGGHVLSARAVAGARADLAALDALSFALLRDQQDPAALALKVVARTADTPALPYIAGPGADAAAVFAALEEGIAALAPADRATLRLRGILPARAADYLAVPNPPPPAQFGGPA